MAEEVEITKSGYLTKLGDGVKNWKRRFFVLHKELLTYYKDEIDYQKKSAGKGEINMHGARVLVIDSRDYNNERDFLFGITPAMSARTYVISAESNSQRDEWVKVLSQVGVIYNSYDGQTRIRSSTLPSDTKMDPRSIHEGYMTKQGEFMKSWKTRYFCMYAHELRYYKKKGDTVAAGVIPLGGGVKLADEDFGAEKRYGFSITITSNSHRKYLLYTDTEQERKTWLRIIRQHSRLRGDHARRSTESLDSSDLIDSDRIIVKHSWLTKQGGVMKTWRSRYCVLDSCNRRRTFKYYRSEDVNMTAAGSLTITNNTIIEVMNLDSPDKPFAFGIQPIVGRRKFIFVTDSRESLDRWIKCLQAAVDGHDACNKLVIDNDDAIHSALIPTPVFEGPSFESPYNLMTGRKSRSLTSLDDPNVNVNPELLSMNRSRSEDFKVNPNSQREGWLVKMTANEKQIQRKYVVLLNDRLFYYKKKPKQNESLKSFKQIPLRGATIEKATIEEYPDAGLKDSPYNFLLKVTPQHAKRSYILGTDTPEDQSLWLKDLNNQVKEFGSQIVTKKSFREGFLSRLDENNYEWKKGYYVLRTDATFVQYKSQEEAKYGKNGEDGISLREASIQLLPDDQYNRAFTFTVEDDTSNNNKKAAWILSDETRESMDEWVNTIMYCCEELDELNELEAIPENFDESSVDSDFG